MNINKQIFITSLVLVLSVVYFGLSNIDIVVQDYFYNHETHKWILPWSLEPYKFIFYDGAKRFLILFAVVLLVSSVVFRKKEIVKRYKKGIIVIILSAIFVPSLIGLVKNNTNMPCPKNELHYGGLYPRTAVWEKYPVDFVKPKTKCWPAGHASGGFALLSLFFLFQKKRNKLIGLGIGLFAGWSTGLYKMIIGDHFLSHTVITMIMAWLIILFIVKISSIWQKN
jgi:membrane-associated PAP2 superfamily phosphatase